MYAKLASALEADDIEFVLGVDEVGTGAWAGPVYVAGAVCRKEWVHSRIRDSKKMTPNSREIAVRCVIKPPAVLYWTLSKRDSDQIDRYGLNQILFELQEEVVGLLAQNLSVEQRARTVLVFDGNTPPAERCVPTDGWASSFYLPRADANVMAVSAASIVAKHHRDLAMRELSQSYSGFGFERNVGYGTEEHREALQTHGPCAIHRKSYRPIRELEWPRPQSETPASTLLTAPLGSMPSVARKLSKIRSP